MKPKEILKMMTSFNDASEKIEETKKKQEKMKKEEPIKNIVALMEMQGITQEEIIEHYRKEEISKTLKDMSKEELIEQVKHLLEQMDQVPLLVCKVQKIIDGKPLLILPNKNQFLVEVSKDCEKLKKGDQVLADQRTLTVIKKIKLK